ncbi:hypothetical protein AJ79_03448 [Helicocarpus griseus UAMH5409]|uniref:t-SNARE coiled-coil homology domain-containing protein n=1 Tax=Helicocarpus griseus UAMH5409 TaxID=1447875 RepID=A0A2B7XXU4_9EURO|nr:hypothetical protein AJ79_03448 [Helicocarpus griseus UAMH5409]
MKCFKLAPSTCDKSFEDVLGLLDKARMDPAASWPIYDGTIYMRPAIPAVSTWIRLIDCRYAETKEDFAWLCASINLPLCPHLRLNDKAIIDQFPPPLYPDYSDKSGNPRKGCKFCDTQVYLFERIPSAGRFLELQILRNIGKFESPRDPVWLAHTFSWKHPQLYSYISAAEDWVNGVLNAINNGRHSTEKPPYPEPLNELLFKPVTLPPTSTCSSPEPRAWLNLQSFFGHLGRKRQGVLRDPRASSSLFDSYGGSSERNRQDSRSPGKVGGYGFSGSPGGHLNRGAGPYRAATPNSKGQYSDAVLSSLESQNDTELEGMSAKVKMLKDITIAIGDEIRDSSAFADKMNDTFDNTRVRLRGTMNRMLVMAEKTGVGWKVWLGFFCAVFMLFTYVWLF